MYILGINAYHADASAAIYKDGLLVAATEEERLRRIKHWAGFPSMAIEFCLKEAGINLGKVDFFVIGRDTKAKYWNKWLFLLNHPANIKGVLERSKNAKQVTSLEEAFVKIDRSVSKEKIRSRIQYVEHHRAHLASAFFSSPFEESALLSIDGSGDFTTTMIGVGKGNQIEVMDSLDFPHSIGLFYTCFTQWLGFPYYGDEYKVMGLAPYGTPKYADLVKKLILFKDNGLFELNLKFLRKDLLGIMDYKGHLPQVTTLYSEHFEAVFGKAREKNSPLTQFHKDMARSVQLVTEEVIFHILKGLYNKTGIEQLSIAGGVAQNSVANGKITRNTPFKEVYIPSAGHDAGIAMGAALYVQNQILKRPRMPALWSAYTGSKFSNEEIEIYLNANTIKYKRYPDDELYEIVTNCLIAAGVVGWFSGRAEFGPRALGARSILADPRRLDAKELLNKKIKKRESFRPFAPSILEEYVQEFFEVSDRVPFMEKVFPINPEKRLLIPAVTHVDGTGRLQTVNKEVSPRYYRLIDTFRNKTGIPVLLNTSFNENEPIVNTPEQALDCFLRTNMDMLVLENCVITER